MSVNNDITYMRRALVLAAQGQFTTAPNPNVGCVIVHQNCIVGEGYHMQAGTSHAEVHALAMAKEKARGATAYVTLEPCSHAGKTPPCADALIQAGIARVVIALIDPNPNVSGNGIEKLKKAGIEVKVGVLAEEAEALNIDFLKRMRTQRPYVQLKLAASIDGKTALASGESQWITSEAARQDVQRFRARSDAILSTSTTILADDPKLNVRWHDLPIEDRDIYPEATVRQPIRIILDSRHRLTMKEQVFSIPGEIWWVCKKAPKPQDMPPHISILVDPTATRNINLNWLFEILAAKEINSVWVEAGARLAGALVEGKHVDELILYMAPKLLGSTARGLCEFAPLKRLSDAPQFTFIDHQQIGNDLRLRMIPILSEDTKKKKGCIA